MLDNGLKKKGQQEYDYIPIIQMRKHKKRYVRKNSNYFILEK